MPTMPISRPLSDAQLRPVIWVVPDLHCLGKQPRNLCVRYKHVVRSVCTMTPTGRVRYALSVCVCFREGISDEMRATHNSHLVDMDHSIARSNLGTHQLESPVQLRRKPTKD